MPRYIFYMYIDISIYIYIEHLHATLHMPQFMISICSFPSVSSFAMMHTVYAFRNGKLISAQAAYNDPELL